MLNTMDISLKNFVVVPNLWNSKTCKVKSMGQPQPQAGSGAIQKWISIFLSKLHNLWTHLMISSVSFSLYSVRKNDWKDKKYSYHMNPSGLSQAWVCWQILETEVWGGNLQGQGRPQERTLNCIVGTWLVVLLLEGQNFVLNSRKHDCILAASGYEVSIWRHFHIPDKLFYFIHVHSWVSCSDLTWELKVLFCTPGRSVYCSQWSITVIVSVCKIWTIMLPASV